MARPRNLLSSPFLASHSGAMGSGEFGRPAAIVGFASAAAAERRVAGVAAAARIARQLAEAGHKRIAIAFPGGGMLRDETAADLRRLAPQACIDIADPSELPADAQIVAAPRLDEAEILRATGKAGDGPVSQALNRPISRRISALLLRLPGLRPVHATAGTALIAAAMFLCLLLGGGAGLIAGGLLFHAASIFDGVDGEMARATWRSSPAGAALDSAIDMATNFLFILGVTINLAASGRPEALAWGGWGLGLLAVGLLAIHWMGRAERSASFDLLKTRHRRPGSGRLLAFATGFLITVSSRDFFAFLFAILIVAGKPMAVLHIFGGATTVWILVIAATLPWRRPRPAPQRSA